MAKIRPKKVSQDDIALFLAKNHRVRGRPVKKSTSYEKHARRFVTEFSAASLFEALKDRKTPITLSWIVKKLLEILRDPGTKPIDRIAVLDRLKDLLVLGAIQDPELAEQVQGVTGKSEEKSSFDPFKGGKLKIRGAG